jgi:hypothetical protein
MRIRRFAGKGRSALQALQIHRTGRPRVGYERSWNTLPVIRDWVSSTFPAALSDVQPVDPSWCDTAAKNCGESKCRSTGCLYVIVFNERAQITKIPPQRLFGSQSSLRS